MPQAPMDIRSLARSWTGQALQTLAGIAREGKNESARVAAAIALLDRGWGRAPQAHTIEGEGDIRVTIRHIVSQVPAAQPHPASDNKVVPISNRVVPIIEHDDG